MYDKLVILSNFLIPPKKGRMKRLEVAKQVLNLCFYNRKIIH